MRENTGIDEFLSFEFCFFFKGPIAEFLKNAALGQLWLCFINVGIGPLEEIFLKKVGWTYGQT